MRGIGISHNSIQYRFPWHRLPPSQNLSNAALLCFVMSNNRLKIDSVIVVSCISVQAITIPSKACSNAFQSILYHVPLFLFLSLVVLSPLPSLLIFSALSSLFNIPLRLPIPLAPYVSLVSLCRNNHLEMPAAFAAFLVSKSHSSDPMSHTETSVLTQDNINTTQHHLQPVHHLHQSQSQILVWGP